MSSISDLRHELALLVLSRYPMVVLESAEEAKLEEVTTQVADDLGIPLLIWSATGGLLRPGAGGLADTEAPEKALARIATMQGEVLAMFQDLDAYFDRPDVLRHLRDIERWFSGSRSTLILTGPSVELPGVLAHHAARLSLALPDREELERIVRMTGAELASMGRTTVELKPGQVTAMAEALRGLGREEARRLVYQAALDDGRLDASDLPNMLKGKRQRVRDTGLVEWIEPIPGLAEIGGVGNFKRWAMLRREAFSEAAQRFGLEAPKGVLLTGVPGTGKSLACRALAGEWHMPLLFLEPGRLYNKYIGETESNLRRALGAAEATAPAILWIDEIEKALAADGGTDGGLSQRILGSLLTWMQDRPAPVFLMATANDISRLPIELLRRGRFDEIFFFDLPGEEERQRIFAIHLSRRERDPTRFDLDELGEAADGFTGAEIEGVVAAGLYHAFSERKELSTEILRGELGATKPLSRLRPEAITALRQWGQEHAVPA